MPRTGNGEAAGWAIVLRHANDDGQPILVSQRQPRSDVVETSAVTVSETAASCSKHPLSPAPIYDLGGDGAGSGRYALFINGNDGHYEGSLPEQTDRNRRPLFIVAGRYHEGAKQPVWFDEPKLFMDHDGTPLGLLGPG